MDWITESIAIGNRVEAHDADLRARHGFCSLISLDGSMTNSTAEALGYDDWICASLNDGPGNDIAAFRNLVDTLIAMASDSPPVLVHCHAGRSRSVTLVAGYLVKTQSMSIQQAYDLIGTKRETAVQAGLSDLCRHLVF